MLVMNLASTLVSEAAHSRNRPATDSCCVVTEQHLVIIEQHLDWRKGKGKVETAAARSLTARYQEPGIISGGVPIDGWTDPQ